MPIFAILFLAAYFGFMCATGYLIFSPFKDIIALRASGGLRFAITDLFAAFLPFPIGYASLNGFYPDIDWTSRFSAIFCVLTTVIAGIAWFYGMRLLWRMQVDSSFKRITLLGVVMPAGFVLPIVAPPILISVQSIEQLAFCSAVVGGIAIVLRLLAVWVRPNETTSTKQGLDAG